jgi:predicted transcriptional regulator with HTH domain
MWTWLQTVRAGDRVIGAVVGLGTRWHTRRSLVGQGGDKVPITRRPDDRRKFKLRSKYKKVTACSTPIVLFGSVATTPGLPSLSE